MKLKRKNAYDIPLGFCWFPNGWKLERIQSTPTIVSFEQLLLSKVKPIQGKNRMKLGLQAQTENPNILHHVQPHPQGNLLSDVGRPGL